MGDGDLSSGCLSCFGCDGDDECAGAVQCCARRDVGAVERQRDSLDGHVVGCPRCHFLIADHEFVIVNLHLGTSKNVHLGGDDGERWLTIFWSHLQLHTGLLCVARLVSDGKFQRSGVGEHCARLHRIAIRGDSGRANLRPVIAPRGDKIFADEQLVSINTQLLATRDVHLGHLNRDGGRCDILTGGRCDVLVLFRARREQRHGDGEGQNDGCELA